MLSYTDDYNVCLGTDNLMLNSPDLFVEMEFIYKISSLKDFVEPKEILKTVTINPANALNINKETQNLKYSKIMIEGKFVKDL